VRASGNRPDVGLGEAPIPNAYADGHFFAGGRVQSASTDLTRVLVRWDDGYVLEDKIQNGIALLFGARDALAPRVSRSRRTRRRGSRDFCRRALNLDRFASIDR
jgi:hypothetical protein